MKLYAVDTDRSVSDVFVDAARDHLRSHGVASPPAPVPADPPDVLPCSAVSDLFEAIERQGARIEEVLRRVEDQSALGRPESEAPRPVGTKAADAMRTLLGVLREAGVPGLSSRDLATAMYGAGVTPGAAETAKAVLRGAGVVLCERRHWFVDGV